ncbi:MAG: hypothetical protein H6862_00175 [Rhodospirillales bacterium]|nr:hypothetical protein [Rhodospirillales bacterium]
MSGEILPSGLIVLLTAFTSVACPNQSPYDLRFADGREFRENIGLRACLDAFNAHAEIKTGGYEAVCISGPNDRILRIRPIEMTPLGDRPDFRKGEPLSGKLATQSVDWGSLPSWARGPFYSMRAASL